MSWKKLVPLEDKSLAAVDWTLDEEVFYNDRYVVQRRKAVPGASEIVRADNLDGPLWLVIERLDGQPVTDWRHKQRIKNELAGPEREAVEIFPSERRLIDASNASHVWALPAGARVPFGFELDRVVLDAGERDDGAVQRPLDDDDDAPARASVGRNERCPCGSGAKYKRCCGA